ncbi:MAG TPA: HAD-IC family P-type ATPase [Alphaproteobacteria bacterium]|nr:HAD-IC family P-type ATPase [Alphaproteobacteria bacterium]
MTEEHLEHPFHALPADQAFSTLRASDQGLASDEAARRLQVHGPNRLPAAPRRSAARRFLAQFQNVLIYVLIAAAAVTAALGHLVDAGVILAVVIVNTTIGFIQEGRAEQAMEAIRKMLAPRSSVLRDGRRQQVDAAELVPGDIVLVEAGDRVPADLRVIEARGLKAEEAILTGESIPTDKGTAPAAPDASLGDRVSMLFSGTLVAAGTGRGVVVATGIRTEIGRISGMLSQVETLTTPLIRQMNTFARWLTLAILGLAALIFVYGVMVRAVPSVEMFMVVVGLAVAAIPEGLPAILTIALAIGVQRMAGRNAIIRRLPAVETLGSVSVICSDKTGTLTRNEMVAASLAAAEHVYSVGGTGYAPEGAVRWRAADADPGEHAVLMEFAMAAGLCNDAVLHQAQDNWQVHGDPMEGALMALAGKISRQGPEPFREWTRTDAIPFDAAHRYMAVLHHDHEGHACIHVKGAPEAVLAMCADQRATDGGTEPLNLDHWHGMVEELAAEGQRVIAVATRSVEQAHVVMNTADLDGNLTLIGLIGLIDPPRTEAIEAVGECHAAGIRVKMITGDHAATARAIAARIGLKNAEKVLTGADIETMDDAKLAKAAVDTDVFARTSPEHKLRLVTALQSHGMTVAMTGDGVNDAPALKRADAGIAMGQKGSEAAKEAAEFVLADDDFASIAAAVREGRTVYDNLKKAIVFLLPVNGGESFAIIAAVLLGYTLPITPLQILWVNMVSSVGLAIALAFEPAERDVMRRPPRPVREPMLSGFLAWRIAFVSVLFVAGLFGMFAWSRASGATLEEARTYAVNTLVVMEVFYLFSVRYLRSPSLTLTGVQGTRAVLIAVAAVVALQAIFTYAPFMSALFETRPVDFAHGAEIIAIGIALFVILEIEKWARLRLNQRTEPAPDPADG